MAKKTGKIKKSTLNPKQELFCQLFAGDREFFGNGVQAYIEAYNIPPTGYSGARSSAHDLLTNPDILARINEIFEGRGLNDAFVDKQLEKLITQDADFSAKTKAIAEYNKLRQRITKKVEVSMNNETIEKLKRLDENELAKIADSQGGAEGVGASGDGEEEAD